IERLTTSRGAISHVAFSPGGDLLAADDSLRTVRLWKLEGGQVREWGEAPGDGDEVCSMSFAPNGKCLAVGGEEGLHLWDLTGERCEELSVFGFRGKYVPCIAFSPDSHTLAWVGGIDFGTIRLWDLSGLN